jgi:hypothetical protein
MNRRELQECNERLCWAIARISGGVNPMLRFSLFASVVVSVLAGNIWGYRSHIVQEAEKQVGERVVGPGWMESVEIYFAALPKIWRGEILFLIGGVLGSWIGLRLLKSAETVDVK